MDTLGLGAASVIRYNDGFDGILNLLRIISGPEPSLRSRRRSGERNDRSSKETIGRKKCLPRTI